MLDQPAGEIIRLEKILDAFDWYEDYQAEREKARTRNKQRHAPTAESVIEH